MVKIKLELYKIYWLWYIFQNLQETFDRFVRIVKTFSKMIPQPLLSLLHYENTPIQRIFKYIENVKTF